MICRPACAICATRSVNIASPLAIGTLVGHLERRAVVRPRPTVIVDARGGDIRTSKPFPHFGQVGLVSEGVDGGGQQPVGGNDLGWDLDG
jgi:hypothetical protein